MSCVWRPEVRCFALGSSLQCLEPRTPLDYPSPSPKDTRLCPTGWIRETHPQVQLFTGLPGIRTQGPHSTAAEDNATLFFLTSLGQKSLETPLLGVMAHACRPNKRCRTEGQEFKVTHHSLKIWVQPGLYASFILKEGKKIKSTGQFEDLIGGIANPVSSVIFLS